MTIATTSSNIYNSSTTIATSGTSLNGLQYLWPTNTYLVFSFNATNTAVCTVGVHFIPL
jgi:xanthine dehydrogenase molybdopterin-binding subunit B